MEQRTLLYDERFLESYAGAIITDPATAKKLAWLRELDRKAEK